MFINFYIIFSKRLSEDDLKSMMSTSMVQEVLAMKIPQSRVEMALKQRGKLGYPSANELASAALSVQLEQTRIIPDPRAVNPSTSESQQPTSSSTVSISFAAIFYFHLFFKVMFYIRDF